MCFLSQDQDIVLLRLKLTNLLNGITAQFGPWPQAELTAYILSIFHTSLPYFHSKPLQILLHIILPPLLCLSPQCLSFQPAVHHFLRQPLVRHPLHIAQPPQSSFFDIIHNIKLVHNSPKAGEFFCWGINFFPKP